LWLAEAHRDRCYLRDGRTEKKEFHLPYLFGKVASFWKGAKFPKVRFLHFHRARLGGMT
jgi:hypothetical protein